MHFWHYFLPYLYMEAPNILPFQRLVTPLEPVQSRAPWIGSTFLSTTAHLCKTPFVDLDSFPDFCSKRNRIWGKKETFNEVSVNSLYHLSSYHATFLKRKIGNEEKDKDNKNEKPWLQSTENTQDFHEIGPEHDSFGAEPCILSSASHKMSLDSITLLQPASILRQYEFHLQYLNFVSHTFRYPSLVYYVLY